MNDQTMGQRKCLTNEGLLSHTFFLPFLPLTEEPPCSSRLNPFDKSGLTQYTVVYFTTQG